MIHVTRQAGVLLLYAEELFFTPKYLKAKEMAEDGAFGEIHLINRVKNTWGRIVHGSGTSICAGWSSHEALVRGLRVSRRRKKNTYALLRKRAAETHRSVVPRFAAPATCPAQVSIAHSRHTTDSLCHCSPHRSTLYC